MAAPLEAVSAATLAKGSIMSSLRIAQVNAADHGGGAEKIALSLHQGYLAKGLRAWLTVDRSYSDELSVLEIPQSNYGSKW
mgnify:CR=1 FL=1